jgi:hypothetical protein
MKKKHLYLMAFILVVFSIGGYVVYSMYNKPHKTISEEDVDFRLTVDEMIGAFDEEEKTAQAKFLDKVIVLEGVLKSFSGSENAMDILILEGKNGRANCGFSSVDFQVSESIKPGDKLFVKGLFIGYDDLLGELQLKKCTIIPSDSKH